MGVGKHDLRVPGCSGQWSSTERGCVSLTVVACSNREQGPGAYMTASLCNSILDDDFLLCNPSASGSVTHSVPLGCSQIAPTTCIVPLVLRSRSEWFSTFPLALLQRPFRVSQPPFPRAALPEPPSAPREPSPPWLQPSADSLGLCASSSPIWSSSRCFHILLMRSLVCTPEGEKDCTSPLGTLLQNPAGVCGGVCGLPLARVGGHLPSRWCSPHH